MKKVFTYILLIIATQLSLLSCSDDKVDGAVFSLKSGTEEISQLSFAYGEAYVLLALSSNTDWTLTSDQPWCELSNVAGTSVDVQYIKVSVAYNNGDQNRTATLTFNAGGNIKQYQVVQASKNGTTCPTGMEQDAIDVVKSIHMGWNLGNTLEAIGGETAWGNPVTTREMIEGVKAKGFNAVRIPCSWNQYLDGEGRITDEWMNHVKEIVGYCVDAGMYAIINIHWDNGWQDESCDASTLSEDQIAQVESKVADIWTQIATAFIDYDGHLLFAGANEPAVSCREDMLVLKRYEQAFVDAVRATGGNNAYRNLIVQGPSTNIDYTDVWMDMPMDVAPARLLAEVHYYSPFNFCINDDVTTCTYFWGEPYAEYGTIDEGFQEDYVLSQFAKMKARFVDRGIPVILGEFGATLRELEDAELQEKHLESVGYFMGYVTEQAKNHGLAPFVWDTGGLYDRTTFEMKNASIYNQMMAGADNGQYPF